MNKTCARCEKTVYPTEELKCLDKTWHKGCFKCQECGMTLNMRTYKGYGKRPYCESHVPKAKHTTMAETPELKRIAENTKLQSNVNYHADFEKSKGKFTQVADDPETLRIKANTKIISNVAYHGDLEKKAQMEKQRQINENGEIVDVATNDNYHQQIETYATEMLAPVPPPNLPPKNHYQTPVPQTHRQYTQEYRQDDYYAYPKYEDYPQNANYQSTPQIPQNFGNQKIGAHHTQQQQSSRHIGRVTDLDPLANEPAMPHIHQNHQSQVKQRVYIAMYDYEANDSDEVSFREGDYISNVTSIDEGWMTGQVLRTGRTGMLPANYVELAPDTRPSH
ncbi:LIM and SH3 domain protein Lasp-like isoform X2 [Pararge aegeria]|uniref:LIM and SH3 domain protein Lasp-like isoform X2 n=1 Tax=Pararge aegeria TaxID=116150 RepID=UPI0019D0AD0D|nr:LIM and SH3 domain protein Lasp-like isoform X2 [Pararge aegeria]